MALSPPAPAQPPSSGGRTGPAELDRLALDVLRDVHNRGADLYNRGDPAGCYRLYQGALLVVRPFLGHRPVLQKVIEDGLAEVSRTDGVKIQAFRLHEVIEDVRGRLKVELKLLDSGAVKTPKPGSKKAAATTGTVLLDGKPAAGVEVTLVTLDEPFPKVFVTQTNDQGACSFSGGLPRGKYVAMVTPSAKSAVPERYQTTGTSGLTINLAGPGDEFQLNLASK